MRCMVQLMVNGVWVAAFAAPFNTVREAAQAGLKLIRLGCKVRLIRSI